MIHLCKTKNVLPHMMNTGQNISQISIYTYIYETNLSHSSEYYRVCAATAFSFFKKNSEKRLLLPN